MSVKAGDEYGAEFSKGFRDTAPFFNLWCQTHALLHIGPALSHVLVDCSLRNAVFPARRGGFRQLEFAPFHPDAGENHNLGGKYNVVGTPRDNAV